MSERQPVRLTNTAELSSSRFSGWDGYLGPPSPISTGRLGGRLGGDGHVFVVVGSMYSHTFARIACKAYHLLHSSQSEGLL